MERGECLEVVGGAVRVEDGTEGESVVPAAAEVGHLHAREPWRHRHTHTHIQFCWALEMWVCK